MDFRKTVTWADDPENNYKKPDNTQKIYEAQENINQSNSQQIQQHDYVPTDGNGSAAVANNNINESGVYQYDSNQYDNNGQYQYAQAPDAVGNQNYTNTDYYYGPEQVNQYDQYVAQPEAQSQQQEVISSSLFLLYFFPFFSFVEYK